MQSKNEKKKIHANFTFVVMKPHGQLIKWNDMNEKDKTTNEERV